ncbi:MAG: ferritin-like domain-containing protein [Myxococcales bacterium]|nr:ferritin-like domain-containing protein [Myxococcales bacterium]
MPDPAAPYDFGGAVFDLTSPRDREIVCFLLSQALYGEATGVYCGKSLYAARSLEAARFYLRQARQELNHLQLFAEIFRILEMTPRPAHWVVRLLATHNNYYPLKVLLEHALGEGMVLDVFRDVLLQTLPDADPRVPAIKKKLRVVCREEQEHVAWGEKETRRVLAERPWLRWPFYGLLELQMALVPLLVRGLRAHAADHPVLRHVDGFVRHVRERVFAQGRALGFVPERRPGLLRRLGAMLLGLALLVRSRFARSRSHLEKIYLRELGFEPPGLPPPPPAAARPQ